MASFLSRLAGTDDASPGATLVEPGRTIASSIAQMEFATQDNARDWGLGDGGTWSLDAEAERITFRNAKGWTITAPFQVIGVLNPKAGQFIWSWAHPAIAASLAAHAERARAFGEKHGLEDYTAQASPASEEDAWEFTAVAAHLSGAKGTYRAPADGKLVFLTFGEVTIDRG